MAKCYCGLCEGDYELCEICEGTGEIWDEDEDDFVECPECDGSGYEAGW
jgi:hypothetical protein